MGDGKIIGPFRIVDNGIRTFVPPCFCFDLVAKNDDKLATVSAIDASVFSIKKADDFSFASENRSAFFSGYIEEYAVPGPGSGQQGLKIVLVNRE